MTKGKIGFHGGNVAVQRLRVRGYDGYEVELPSWTAAQAEDWLSRWAKNLMLIMYRRASYGAPYDCLRAIYRPSPATAPLIPSP